MILIGSSEAYMMNENISELVNEFLDDMKTYRNCTPKSIKAYKLDLTNILSNIDHEIKDINEIDIKILRTALNKTFKSNKPVTIKRKLSVLKSFYKFLSENEYINKNPTLALKSPKLKRKKKLPLTHDQVKQIIEYFPRYYSNKIELLLPHQTKQKEIYEKRMFKWDLLIGILFNTMVRIGEVLQMQYKDIDYDNGNFIIHGKGMKDRIIPLPKNIQKIKIKNKDEYIFSRLDGKPYSSPRYLQIKIKLLGKKLNIPNLTPHSFRRTSASFAINKNVSLNILQKYLGHSSPATTEAYYAETNIESLKSIDFDMKNNFL